MKKIRYPWKKRTRPAAERSGQPSQKLPEVKWLERPLSGSLDENEQAMKDILRDCSDIIFRKFTVTPGRKALLVFLEGTVKTEDLQLHILQPVIQALIETNEGTEVHLEPVDETRISLSQVKSADQFRQVTEAVLDASAVLFLEGLATAYLFSVKGGMRRGVQEPETEAVIRGPREGFNETLRVNTALLRFKLKNPMFKLYALTLGEQTKTSIALAYIEGIAGEKLIEDVKQRLHQIKIDAVLETGYIEELIEDHPHSPFPQMQYTERPDTVVAQLLEGRFAILVDGTPFALIGPVTMWQMLQASEDYYERFFISNMVRWIRFFFLTIALFLPALYIAVTTFHQDMLPTTLILSIAAARESIPFPAIVEAMMMEVSFEALREAGIRLPKTVGQAVSILGALVIGQAAVQAGIVSAPVVIIVSLTGIASFTIPRFNFAITVRMLRFPLMILAGAFGLFGIIIGMVLITVHLTKLTSFGMPYLAGFSPYSHSDQKDILVRTPWWNMMSRPSWLAPNNEHRQKKGMNGRQLEEKEW
ncbi:spore germination protein [Paenibacillus medicaginis]|uniref:Spore germination protein n=1 Tax=Paenibacillus medicaginis TaxID=1470560 RepID=A0ABV5BXH4_9BACL